MTERRHDLAAWAILALVPTLLFGDLLFGSGSLYVRDVAHYFYPAKKVLRELVLAGHFPYWNPTLSAGQPVAANPAYEVFYPPTWLILLPDYHRAFQLLTLLHIYLAIFGMYALLRSMRLGRPAACFGALSFGIGGLLVSTMNLQAILFSTAWLPLTCLFARRFLREGRSRDFALASLFLALQLLVAEPVTVLQTGLILGIYALYRGFRDHAPAKPLLAIAMICVTALLLAAVQVLPAVDHLRDSSRGRGMAWESVKEWSTPPLRFAELLFPNLLGHVDPNGNARYWGSKLYAPRFTPFFFSIYAGLAAAVLALAGVMARVRGWILFAALLLLSLLLAAGDHTPLLRLLYDGGIAGLVRFTEKFLITGVFALTVFSAHVLQHLLDGEVRAKRAALAIAVAVSVAGFAAAAVVSFERTDWLLVALRGLLLAILIRNVTGARRPLWLAFFGAFVLLDLSWQTPTVAPRIDRSFFTTAPAVVQRFRPERNDFRIFHLADWGKDTSRARLYRRAGDTRYWIARNGLSPQMAQTYGLRTVIDGDFDVTDLQPEQDFTAAVWELAAPGGPPDWIDVAMSMSNAWYVGLYRDPKEALAHGWTRDVEPVKFVEGRHYPRYYFATRLVTMHDHDDFVRQLRTHRFPRQVAFIREPSFVPARGIVHGKREWSNGAHLDVTAAGRAFLVMSVTPHKYWRITIDGTPAPALVTNIGYQGVVVPAGRHVVEMRYRNPLIAIGGGFTAVALIALLGMGFRRHSTRHPCASDRAQSFDARWYSPPRHRGTEEDGENP